MSSFVVFAPADIEAGQSLRGAAVDVIAVRGGEVVRLELRDNRALEIAERASTAESSTESWLRVEPRERLLWLRPTAFTTALLVPHDSVLRAHVGHSSEPGYYWFELEDRVLSWADGALPAPFPRVGPAQRIDYAAFAELDHALAEAVAAAARREDALRIARAVRRVAGMRALRALRPVNGFPNFFNERPETGEREPRPDSSDPPTYDVSPSQPLEVRMQGPALFHVFAALRVTDAEDPMAEVRVFEGDRLRARTVGLVPRVAVPSADPAALDVPAGYPLRRATVHVPPGEHVYRIQATSPALVTPLRAEAVVHLEDEAVKDERASLEVARRACSEPRSPALCAMALALLGEDRADVQPHAGELGWQAALEASPEVARRVSETLAGGGPADPTLALELAASNGDPRAIAELSKLAREAIDDGTRSSWLRSLWRGTSWGLVPSEGEGPTWMALAGDDPAVQACAANAPAAWSEVTATEGLYMAMGWHGVRSIELAVVADCDDARAIELAVDGQKLEANPSARFVSWHVRVRGDAARVQRLDRGHAHVYALRAPGQQQAACAQLWSSIRAPQSAADGPALAFRGAAPALGGGTASDGPDAPAPGLEIWLRHDIGVGELRVSALDASPDHAHALHIVAARAQGPVAYDERGALFTRVARVALPAWAAAGVQVQATKPGVAVRALVRVPRVASPTAAPVPAGAAEAGLPLVPLDENALIELSRRILAASGVARGRLHFERALLLAAGGAARAALADARAADALGAIAPGGVSAVLSVQRAIRQPPEIEAWPSGVAAYGVEPDFDPATRRCVASRRGPRAQLARLLAQQQSSSPQAPPAYESMFAARAVAASRRTPLDPRGSGLVARALADSRWQWKRDVGRPAQRVWQTSARYEGAVDSRGELRPRVALGAIFETGTYATLTVANPAEVSLAGIARGTKMRVDLVCAALEPALAMNARCPVEVRLGGEVQHPALAADGAGAVVLTINQVPDVLTISVAPSEANWVARARVALDREAPGSMKVPGVGWVVISKGLEPRVALAADAECAIEVPAGAVYRIDARPEGEAAAELLVGEGRQQQAVPLDGSPVVIGSPERSRIVLKSVRGAVSVGVAERVPLETAAVSSGAPLAAAVQQATFAATLDPNASSSATAAWLVAAEESPPPLAPFERSFGTIVSETGAVYGTLREGSAPSTAPDAYVFQSAGYRRRLEAIGLWTDFDAFGRLREGEPSYGAKGLLYEEIESIHLRLSTSLGVTAQNLDDYLEFTWVSRGFVEYSWRATSDFFVLPRLGYDTMFMSLLDSPSDLDRVDDEVYNAYRRKRPTLVFAQAMLWYTPHFNEIVYLRLRTTYNPLDQNLSHASARPGVFFAFGSLDLSAYLDSAWYPPADSRTHQGRFSENAGFATHYSLWAGLGSFAVQPGLAAFYNFTTGGYQVGLFVDVFASFRRGVRDFSSLELDFPEQLGGGIPWRGDSPGGYR